MWQCDTLVLQAILFLQQLLDFHETAGAMLASQGTAASVSANIANATSITNTASGL